MNNPPQPLTPRQQQVLDFVRGFAAREGVPPTAQEIRQGLEFSSTSMSRHFLLALERRGALILRRGRARGILLTAKPAAGSFLRIPVFGSVPAGFPRGGGGQEPDSFISIAADTLHVPSGAHTFALRVRGDSMTGAGILDGDSIILEFRDPHHGDIVAALIDGETTLKRYLVRQGLPYLRAENPHYPDLIPARELVVQGVMVALLRVPHAVPRLRP
ncbi:MAG: transcriptional repressor, LexA family [Verrucomicrobiales bacterium]|nr:transcriptional repressor, LexA family [Verrucomicrobiales bacterium]